MNEKDLELLVKYIDERITNLKLINYFERLDTFYSFINFNAELYNSIIELIENDIFVFMIHRLKKMFLDKGLLLNDDCYLSINVKENNSSIWYEFRKTLDDKFQTSKLNNFIEKHNEMICENNSLVFIFLNIKDKNAEKMLFEKYRRLTRYIEKSKVSFAFFEDFVMKYFGQETLEEFKFAFNYLEEKCKKLIGYDVTEICTQKAKEEFNNKHFSSVLNVVNYVKDSVFNSLKPYYRKIITNNFEKNKKILLDEFSFSKSLFTSEWVFDKYNSFENLDKTFVVAGYLKCVEQLLSSIILVKGKGKKIKTFNGYVIVDEVFIEDSTYINASLNQFREFIEYKMFDRTTIDKTSLHIICEKLKDWIDRVRNGYFHKHNLEKYETVVEIRNETYQLLFYILGCFTLNETDIRMLK